MFRPGTETGCHYWRPIPAEVLYAGGVPGSVARLLQVTLALRMENASAQAVVTKVVWMWN